MTRARAAVLEDEVGREWGRWGCAAVGEAATQGRRARSMRASSISWRGHHLDITAPLVRQGGRGICCCWKALESSSARMVTALSSRERVPTKQTGVACGWDKNKEVWMCGTGGKGLGRVVKTV